MKNKPHEISFEEIQKHYHEAEVVLAASSRERKRLIALCNGNLKVMVGGTCVWQGMQLYSAVEAYNEIIEKWVDENAKFTL